MRDVISLTSLRRAPVGDPRWGSLYATIYMGVLDLRGIAAYTREPSGGVARVQRPRTSAGPTR